MYEAKRGGKNTLVMVELRALDVHGQTCGTIN